MIEALDKYADRKRMIELCAGIAERLEGVTDLAERDIRRKIGADIRALIAIYAER